jgi:hypothetical protein
VLGTAAVAIAAIVWAIAYAITLRKASTAWKAGSLVGFVILSCLVELSLAGRASRSLVEDAADTITQVQQAAKAIKSGKGAADIKFNAGSGVMSRMMAKMINPLLADSAAYERDAKAQGLYQVVTFEGLTKASPVLDHCERLDAFGPRARAVGSRVKDHLADARAIGEEAVRSGELPREAMRGWEAGVAAAGSDTKAVRQWELLGRIADDAAAMCRILGLRKWDKPGNTVLFRKAADLKAIKTYADRINGNSAEAERMRAEGMAAVQGEFRP